MTRSPTMHADRPTVRVAIVTMDMHLSRVVMAARAKLAREIPGLALSLHAAAEWENNPAALERCKADIASADIVIATMIFLDDHIRSIKPALEARRDQCDAMIVAMSAAEMVKLTRIGAFTMDKPQKGLLALIKKLRGSSDSKGMNANSGAKQMAMLRRLPKLLRLIPGKAQDVRAYFLTMQYWFAGSEENVVQMVRFLVDRYADGARKSLRGTLDAAPPAEYPDVGVYHPRMKGGIGDRVDALPPSRGKAGTVGVLVMRSYVLAKDTAHYDGVISALESKGLQVIPAFSSGLDSRPAVEKFFIASGKPTVDVLVSLTGFSLVGGPAYNDSAAAEEILARLDVPYIAAQPVEFQTLERWASSAGGLTPVEATVMVAIPELDGAIAPTIFGGRSDGSGDACIGCDKHCVFETHTDAQIGHGVVQLPTKFWRCRLCGISRRVRVGAQHAQGTESRRLRSRCARKHRCIARKIVGRKRRCVRHRCERSSAHSRR
jgi:magnesium chelatase subunit H